MCFLCNVVYLPLSIQCTVASAVWQATQREACKSTPMCCTTDYLQTWAAVSWCNSGINITPITGPAFGQYAVSGRLSHVVHLAQFLYGMTERTIYCHSRGLQVDNVQLELSPAQTGFLNYLYRRDKRACLTIL
jgi:hypothetical protein